MGAHLQPNPLVAGKDTEETEWRLTFPPEVLLLIAEALLSSSARRKGGQAALNPSHLMPLMSSARVLYNFLAPFVFRKIRCCSELDVSAWLERLTLKPLLVTYIRELNIEQLTEPQWIHNDATLPQLLGLLGDERRLETLSVQIGTSPRTLWRAYHKDIKNALLSITGRHTTLKTLRLVNTDVSTTFLDNLGVGIRTLEVIGVSCKHGRRLPPTLPTADPEPTALGLESITFWASWSTLSTITSRHSLPNLTYLHFPSFTSAVSFDQKTILEVMSAAPNLDRVRLSIGYNSSKGITVDRLASNEGSVRHLELSQSLKNSKSEFSVPSEGILEYLSATRQPSKLETLTIVMESGEEVAAGKITRQLPDSLGGFKKLFAMLQSTSSFPDLRSVRLDLCDLDLEGDIARLVERRAGELAAGDFLSLGRFEVVV